MLRKLCMVCNTPYPKYYDTIDINIKYNLSCISIKKTLSFNSHLSCRLTVQLNLYCSLICLKSISVLLTATMFRLYLSI